DGEVQVSATSFESGETGAYSIQLEEGGRVYADQRGSNGRYERGGQTQTSQPTPGATAIRVGESRDGRLGQGARTLSSGEYVNTFTVRGRRGQQLDLRLNSTEFDPYLQITGPGGFSAYNDDDADASDSRNSRLIVTLPADGAYEIAATSYEAGESGRYRFSVADGAGYRPPAAPNSPHGQGAGSGGAIRIGQTISGALQAGDDTLDSGEYLDSYTFRGQRGQRVAAELTSSAFDAYIMLTTPSGEQIEVDDGADGTDSRLETALSEDGEYTVTVTSFAPGETGSYRFSVSPSQGSTRQASVTGGPRVFAIMVGISDYGDDEMNLPYTDDDALKLAETLRREGVLNPSSVTLTNAQATVAGVEDAFRRVARQAGPDDMFLFFFSGHGSQTDGEVSQVSATEPDGRSEGIVLRDGEISDTEMARLFGTLRTRLSLLVLDSCFSGGFARNVVDRPGVMGLFSSEEDLTSAVADKFEAGGYLAHFLRTGLSGAADADGDTMVTAGELATYLRRGFTTEVNGVEAETSEGQRNYQNLVIDRGGVQIDDVIIRLASDGNTGAGGR
ncbi:MAG: peptidase caspase catalytic subunit p20, partial [Brevundimonas sp.]|nr:peptidase caspase catalytic subunit p20 [Brevundimonas sp.]